METTKTPVKAIELGRLRASIWPNAGDRGRWYSVTLHRLYVDSSGSTRPSTSLGRNDLLTASILLQDAFRWIEANPPENEREDRR